MTWTQCLLLTGEMNRLNIQHFDRKMSGDFAAIGRIHYMGVKQVYELAEQLTFSDCLVNITVIVH